MTSEQLTIYVESLRAADPDDAGRFQMLVAQGSDLLRLVDKDLTRALRVSFPNVTRWKNGKSAPHSAMRKPVYEWLTDCADLMLRKLARVAT